MKENERLCEERKVMGGEGEGGDGGEFGVERFCDDMKVMGGEGEVV